MKKNALSLRKCVGCHQMKEKKELIRVVRTIDEQFCIDYKGHMQGRGAYLCQNLNCLEKAEKRKGLERSFKTSIDTNFYQILHREFEVHYGK